MASVTNSDGTRTRLGQTTERPAYLTEETPQPRIVERYRGKWFHHLADDVTLWMNIQAAQGYRLLQIVGCDEPNVAHGLFVLMEDKEAILRHREGERYLPAQPEAERTTW